MPIYATPFLYPSLEYTGESVPCGFKDLNQVAYAMPWEISKVSTAYIICGHGEHRTLFSKIPFYIDRKDNSG